MEQGSDKGAAGRLNDPPGSWELTESEGPRDRQDLEKEGLSSQMTEQCVMQCTEVQAITLRGASPLPYPNGARVSDEDSLHSAVELELGLQGYADSPWPHKPAHNQTRDAEVGTTLGTNLALTWRRWRRIHFDQTWVTQTGLSGQRSIRQKQMEIAVRTWRRTTSSEKKRAVDEAWHHQSNFYLWEQRRMKVAMEKMSLARLIEDSCKRRNVWNYGAMQHGERGAVRVQKVSRVMHFIKWLNAHRTGEGERQKVRYMQSYRKHNAVKTWHAWFMSGRYMSKKGIKIAMDAMDRLRKAKHFRRIRQHCSDTRARELIIRQLYRAAGCPQQRQVAQQTARALYDRWIPHYGTPETLVTDSHPSFASGMIDESFRRCRCKGGVQQRGHGRQQPMRKIHRMHEQRLLHDDQQERQREPRGQGWA